MKKKFLEMLKKKEARKAELGTKANASQDVAELRSINAEIEALNAEITELRNMIDEMPDDAPEGRGAAVVPQGHLNPIATIVTPAATTAARAAEVDIFDTIEYRTAFMNYARTGVIGPELRIDATTQTTDISVIIPTTIMNEVVQKLKSYGQIYGRIRKTAFKGGVKIPTASVKPTATWKTEGSLSDKQKKEIKTFIEFSYYKLQCRIATSLEADTVALPVFESTIAADMAEAIVVAVEIAVIKGTGIGEPKGILAHTAEIPAAQQITISSADMQMWDKWKKNIFANIPLAYEGGGVWVMTKATFEGYIDGMVDANGQPIARTNYGITGAPVRRFGGYDVLCVEADYLPNYISAANTDVFAIFVDFNEYIFNSNLQLTLKRYFDEDTDEWIDKATLIGDGKLRDANGVLLIKKGA